MKRESKVQVTGYIPESEYKKLEAVASTRGVSLSHLVRQACLYYSAPQKWVAVSDWEKGLDEHIYPGQSLYPVPQGYEDLLGMLDIAEDLCDENTDFDRYIDLRGELKKAVKRYQKRRGKV